MRGKAQLLLLVVGSACLGWALMLVGIVSTLRGNLLQAMVCVFACLFLWFVYSVSVRGLTNNE